MPTVVATVVRRGRTFSGDATARVAGVVGGGRDGPPRLFGYRAVMIARACSWLFQRRGARSSVANAVTCS
jgi:hypothetical protein